MQALCLRLKGLNTLTDDLDLDLDLLLLFSAWEAPDELVDTDRVLLEDFPVRFSRDVLLDLSPPDFLCLLLPLWELELRAFVDLFFFSVVAVASCSFPETCSGIGWLTSSGTGSFSAARVGAMSFFSGSLGSCLTLTFDECETSGDVPLPLTRLTTSLTVDTRASLAAPPLSHGVRGTFLQHSGSSPPSPRKDKIQFQQDCLQLQTSFGRRGSASFCGQSQGSVGGHGKMSLAGML